LKAFPQHVYRDTDGSVDLKHMESSFFRTLTRGGGDPVEVAFFAHMVVADKEEGPVQPVVQAQVPHVMQSEHIIIDDDLVQPSVAPSPLNVVLPQDAPLEGDTLSPGKESNSLSFDFEVDPSEAQDEGTSRDKGVENPDSVK
jgi:hypothetical protein